MLSLYIHVPFCVGKCRYCGFYSTPYSPCIADEFIDALEQEAAACQEAFRKKLISSIYIGGGTPTTLSQEQLSSLFNIINDHFIISNDAEFTIEANPSSLANEIIALLSERGVNRLSLGVQSFSDMILRTLGRPHRAEEARNALIAAKRFGFENISVDLIYGVPGQTMCEWGESLDAVVALEPAHVSIYSLSFDEGSQFHRDFVAGKISLPEEDLVLFMYERAVEQLGRAGYGRYEISNFSLPGKECRHNMNYWDRGEYLGLGPGSWSFIEGRRYAIVADIPEYLRSLARGIRPVDAHEGVDSRLASYESILLGLRTMKGIDLARFEREYGHELLRQLETNAAPLERTGHLLRTHERLQLTGRGILLSDEVLARLAV